MSAFDIKLSCAIHLANAVVRHDERGQVEDADRTQNRFADIVEAEGDVFLLAVARKLGRKRAKAVAIEPEVVEIAARMPRERFEALVAAQAG